MNYEVVAERFWKRVSVRGSGECWPWTGPPNKRGYGQINVGGMPQGAHRVALILTTGPLKEGEESCHKCDNKLCCNPAHLFRGTQASNMRDKKLKARQPRKYTVQQVREIRELHAEGLSAADIWRRLDIHYSAIKKAINDKEYGNDPVNEWA